MASQPRVSQYYKGSPTADAPAAEEQTPAAAAPPPAAAAPKPPPHPIAVYISDLFGPMSYVDQRWAFNMMRFLLYTSAVIGYAAGWYMESFAVTTYTVLGAAALAALVCGPNWRQRPDAADGRAWLDRQMVRELYEDLDAEELRRVREAGGPTAKPLKHLS